MEHFNDENHRKGDCRDKENDNEEATISNVEGKDPTKEAHNVNDLKTFDFNSADAVRQAMKALYNDKNRIHCDKSGVPSSGEIATAKNIERTDGYQEQNDFDIVILNVSTVNNNLKKEGVDVKKNDETTTSKTEVNSPGQEALNANDLKYIDLISTDDMRLQKNNFIKDQENLQCEESEHQTLTEKMDSKFVVKDDHPQIYGDRVILNVSKVKNTRDKEVNHDMRQTRKRPGRPPKPGPSKKSKVKQATDIFYYGKLSNLIFMKRKYRHEFSSDDDSIFSF